MELEEGPNNDLEKLNVSTNAVSGFVIFTNLKVLSFEATMLLLALNHLKPILLLFATIVESVPEQILTLEGTVGFEGVAAMVIAENFMVSFCKFSSPVNAVKALKLIDPPFGFLDVLFASWRHVTVSTTTLVAVTLSLLDLSHGYNWKLFFFLSDLVYDYIYHSWKKYSEYSSSYRGGVH